MRSRRFVIGAVVAAFAMIVCIPIGMNSLIFLPFAYELALGIALALGIGFLVGWRSRPGRVPLIAGMAALALPLVPTIFVAVYVFEVAAYQLAEAAVEARALEPIVTTDEMGLCEPPVFSSRNGLPVARLVARVPSCDGYAFTFEAVDARGRSFYAYMDTLLNPGRHTIRVRARKGEEGLPVWPVTIRKIEVASCTLVNSPVCKCEDPIWHDVRNGEWAVLKSRN